MYRIYICDDEPWALRDLGSVIDWHAYGFGEVRMFSDPQEALAAIIENQPDAVLTDVRMPGMTGLEMIERCKAAGSEAVFAVVSAYAEFEYAQHALNCGAYSYILKPLEPGAVSRFAETLLAKLNERRMQGLGQNLRALVLRTLTFDHAEAAPPFGQTDLFAAPYRIAVAGKCPDPAGVPWLRIYSDLYLAVLPEPYDRCALPSQCGLSRGQTGGEHAGQQIWEALIAYYSARFYQISSRPTVYHETEKRQYAAGADVLNAMAEGDAKKAQTLLSAYEAQAQEQTAMLSELLHYYNGILSGTFRLFPRCDVQDTLRAFNSCFQLYGVMQDAETFFECLRLLIDDCFHQEREEEADGGSLEEAIRFIDSHYQEALTLEMLSDRFHISLSHLCRQFKQSQNRTFTEYVAQRRVARACELLRQTKLPVSEIGGQVGYADYFYFSRVFKKQVGVSPSAYRKENEDE